MRILIPMITLLAILLSSCSGAEHSMLHQADAVMEQHPDSALSILRTIDRSRISGGDIPYYALLMTQAQVKTDIPLDSDSLISIAYAKYADAWRGDKGIRSSFYMGEVFYNQEKPRDAMRHYLSAYEESKRLGNDYWRAKAAERIADLFFNAFNYPEAARYRKEAIEYFGKANRVTNQRYAVADLATDCMNDSRFEEAVALLDSVYNVVCIESVKDSLLIDYIECGKVTTYAYLSRFEEIDDDHVKALENRRSPKAKIDTDIFKLRFHILNTDSSSDKDIMRMLRDEAITDEDKVLAYYACYQNAVSDGDEAIIAQNVDSLIFYQNAVAQNIIRESVTAAERDFYLSASETHHRRMKLTIAVVCIIGAICCFIALVMWRFHRLKEITRKAELDANVEAFAAMKAKSEKLAVEKEVLSREIRSRMTDLGQLRKQADHQSSAYARLEKEADDYKSRIQGLRKELDEERESKTNALSQLERKSEEYRKDIKELVKRHAAEIGQRETVLTYLFKEKWSTLNMLCEEYFEKGSSLKMRESIQKKIEAEVRNIGTPEGLRQVKEETDRYLDGLVSRLRAECTNLKEKDIQFCCLIFAGFSVRAICFILDITTNNFYVRKKRMLDRIKNTEAPSKELFINHLQ